MRENKQIKKSIFKIASLEWLENKKEKVKKVTYLAYQKVIVNHILPYIQSLTTNTISQDQIRGFNYYLSKLNISRKYILDIASVYNSIICYINNKYLTNYFFECNNVKKDYKELLKTYTKNEQQIIISACLNGINNKKLGILIALFSGMRLGELCALQWKDIDLKNKIIKVSKSVQRVFDINKSYIEISSPKTINSYRSIPISNFLLKYLKQFKNNDDIYILSGRNKIIEPRNYRKYYYKLIKSLNIPYIKFHGLRHTFATNCIEMGIDYKTVSELLGHSSITITMNIYVHISIDHKRKCIEKLTKSFL